MLDSKGHARLIDFGLCKVGVSEDDRTHTRTHCGTNSYMAPEILNKGQLYGPGVDWWSFGILAFDMMCGGPPWKGKDKYETFRYVYCFLFSHYSKSQIFVQHFHEFFTQFFFLTIFLVKSKLNF